VKKYFLIGIAGTGMSGLASFLKSQGHQIWGSDRSFDQEKDVLIKKTLTSLGIEIVPQNGLNLPQKLDGIIYSSAVEKNNPDFIFAQKNSIPLFSRAQMLADIFNGNEGIAIAGTSGKTTVVGMIAQICQQAKMDFSFLCGGKVKGLNSASWRVGKSSQMLIEADESDGTITLYRPKISLITNITKDHKNLDELYPLFQDFVDATQGRVILNEDCSSFKNLKYNDQTSHFFGISQAHKINLSKEGSTFEFDQNDFQLCVPGIHNILNALAAIAVAQILKIPIDEIQKGLKNFQGIERRLELVGSCNQVNIYDDYSHNPAKIEAALSSLKDFSQKLIIVYQPHGFGPLKHQWNDLLQVFQKRLQSKDHLFLLPIYDAGGTAERNISSEEFTQELINQGVCATFFTNRQKLTSHIVQLALPQDSIIIMGARDNTLTELARSILNSLKSLENSKKN
jgi:UDP-N-acetylmuramate--alanine ligase